MKQQAIADSSYNQSSDDAHESRGYEFGPFAPAAGGTYPAARLEDNSKRAFDVENLVSDYRPSYQNQGNTHIHLMFEKILLSKQTY